jgi:hypothetical protein
VTAGRVSTGRASDVVVDAALVSTVVVVVKGAGGATVLFEMDIATELSTSMATTSAGDDPHDTHINNENATVGLIKCLSRGVISRD